MHLFLSPHYDDAIYSCGGLIHQLVRRGERAHILTIMAAAPTDDVPDTPVVRDNHTRWDAGENPMVARRAEDAAAAAIVGATVQYHTVLDCIYRTHEGVALYPDEASLWGMPHPHDPAFSALDQLSASITDATVIYAPLAVGNHVDHQIVRDWAHGLAETHRVKFYTDFPYLRDRGAIESALRAFGQPLQAERILLSEDDMRAKIAGMATYKSQIQSFWDDAAAIEDDVRAIYTGADGAYAEQLWFR